MRSFRPLSRRLGSLCAVVGLTALSAPGLLGTGTAVAEPPTRLPTQVVDSANVLDDTQQTALGSSIDRLYSAHDVQLWVIYVKSFDHAAPQQWAAQTAAVSDLGDRDVLLTVATDNHSFNLSSPGGDDGLSRGTLDKIARNDIAPRVHNGDWVGVGHAAVDGIDDAMAPSHTAAITAGSVGAVVVIGGAGALLYARRRNRRRARSGADSVREQELTAEQLAEQPLDVLDPWSREALTDTDNAVRSSDEELRRATDEFGQTDTEPFTQALATARKRLTESFALRQRLDEDAPRTSDEQRSMLVQIITSCTEADSTLDAQVDDFDSLRNLLPHADSRLAELTRQLAGLRTRLEPARHTVDTLTEAHGDTAVASVADNVTLAEEELEFAEHNADQARDAPAAAAADQGPAVAAIRSAEGAISQAGRLLDAVDNAESTLAAAFDTTPSFASAEAKIVLASYFIATRRGAVQCVARTRLSEAQRSLPVAIDPSGPADEDTRRAGTLADDALAAAQADVAQWRQDNPSAGVAVLTGVLVDSFLREGTASFGGGYSSGGRSPASFGGSGSAGRIGVGGRRRPTPTSDAH